jgi:hypothetical protein
MMACQASPRALMPLPISPPRSRRYGYSYL